MDDNFFLEIGKIDEEKGDHIMRIVQLSGEQISKLEAVVNLLNRELKNKRETLSASHRNYDDLVDKFKRCEDRALYAERSAEERGNEIAKLSEDNKHLRSILVQKQWDQPIEIQGSIFNAHDILIIRTQGNWKAQRVDQPSNQFEGITAYGPTPVLALNKMLAIERRENSIHYGEKEIKVEERTGNALHEG